MNFLVLRYISFGNDQKLMKNESNFMNYLSYMVYAPLYMAGPIISYQNFFQDSNYNPNSTTSKIFDYLLKSLNSFLFYSKFFR